MAARVLQKSVFVGLVVALLTAGAGAQPAPTGDAAGQRSMAFEPGLGEAAPGRAARGATAAAAGARATSSPR